MLFPSYHSFLHKMQFIKLSYQKLEFQKGSSNSSFHFCSIQMHFDLDVNLFYFCRYMIDIFFFRDGLGIFFFFWKMPFEAKQSSQCLQILHFEGLWTLVLRDKNGSFGSCGFCRVPLILQKHPQVSTQAEFWSNPSLTILLFLLKNPNLHKQSLTKMKIYDFFIFLYTKMLKKNHSQSSSRPFTRPR